MMLAFLVLSAILLTHVLVEAQFIAVSNQTSVFDYSTIQTRPVTILEGDPSEKVSPLICVLAGAIISPRIFWLKNNDAIPDERQTVNESNIGPVKVHTNVLTWPNIFSPRDSGTYSCIIEATTTTNLSFVLEVLTPANTEVVMENGKVVNRSLEVLRDSAINLTCSTKGTLPLMFSWWRNGELLQRRLLHSHVDTFVNTSIGREVTGEFACSVTNSLVLSGRADPLVTTVAKNFSLVVIDKPSVDFTIEVPTITSTSVILRWPAHGSDAIDNGNTPITGFSVECESTANRSDRFPHLPGNLTSDIRQTYVRGLHPGRTYECWVTVWNKVGSATSNSTMITTAEESPDQGPQSFRVIEASATNISIAWEPPPPGNHRGVLLYYDVSFEAVNCTNCSCTYYNCILTGQVLLSVSNTAQPPTATLANLRKFTTYEIRIAAANRAGTGPPSSLEHRTDSDIPSIPQGLTALPLLLDEPALNVSWSPPADENGVLENYTLTVVHTRTGETGYKAVPPGSAMKFEVHVKNLLRAEEYAISVSAKTSVGTGQAAELSVTTLARARLEVIMENGNLVNGSFEVLRGSAVNLTCIASGTFPLMFIWWRNGVVMRQSDPLNSNTNSFPIDSTVRELTGQFACSVTNSLQFSGLNDLLVTTAVKNFSFVVIEKPTIKDFPPPNITSLQSTSVLLSWPAANPERVDNGNTPITGFSVDCESLLDRSDRFPRSQVILKSDILKTSIYSLHPGRAYECWVTVWNKVGSARGNSTTVAMLEEPPDRQPRFLQVEQKSSTNILLRWEPPLEENHRGVLLQYVVYFEAINCGQCFCTYLCLRSGRQNISVSGQVSTTTVSVVNLRKFTTYAIRIAAVNSAGTGPYATLNAQTNPERPSSPQNLTVVPVFVNGPGLKASWLPPLDENGVLEDYQLSVLQPRTRDVWRKMVPPAGVKKLEEQVEGLLEGEEYTVSVSASTSIGEGKAISVTVATPVQRAASSSIIGGLDDILFFVIIGGAALLLLFLLLVICRHNKSKTRQRKTKIEDAATGYYKTSFPLQTHSSYNRGRARSTNFNTSTSSNNQEGGGQFPQTVTFRQEEANMRQPVLGFNSQPYSDVAVVKSPSQPEPPTFNEPEGSYSYVVTNMGAPGVIDESGNASMNYSTVEDGKTSTPGNPGYATVEGFEQSDEQAPIIYSRPGDQPESEQDRFSDAGVADDHPTYTLCRGDHILTVM